MILKHWNRLLKHSILQFSWIDAVLVSVWSVERRPGVWLKWHHRAEDHAKLIRVKSSVVCSSCFSSRQDSPSLTFRGSSVEGKGFVKPWKFPHLCARVCKRLTTRSRRNKRECVIFSASVTALHNKTDVLPLYFCLAFQHKYLNFLNPRCLKQERGNKAASGLRKRNFI